MYFGDLYVDMDGVVVDFINGVKDQTGYDWNVPAKDKIEKRARGAAAFESGSEFWSKLRPMHDFEELWNFLHPHAPRILSAYPRGFDGESPTETSIKYAKEGKWLWNLSYLDVPKERFHVVAREEKRLFATKVVGFDVLSNVLIDDHAPNIKEWNDNRGVGILHTSAADTIKRLKELGF